MRFFHALSKSQNPPLRADPTERLTKIDRRSGKVKKFVISFHYSGIAVFLSLLVALTVVIARYSAYTIRIKRHRMQKILTTAVDEEVCQRKHRTMGPS
jgi:hypothetical protein